MISLLRYYGWKKFSIIHDERWTAVADSLKEQAIRKNMTINHNEKVIDNHKCCENFLACCRSGYWYQVSYSINQWIEPAHSSFFSYQPTGDTEHNESHTNLRFLGDSICSGWYDGINGNSTALLEGRVHGYLCWHDDIFAKVNPFYYHTYYVA